MVEPLAKVLAKLGVRRGMVVYGQDRLDEISLSAPTTVCEIRDGKSHSYVLRPEDVGLKTCKKEDGITLEEGVRRAAQLIDSKQALHKLEAFIKLSNEVQMSV